MGHDDAVSKMCWFDDRLYTASWDSTVKVKTKASQLSVKTAINTQCPLTILNYRCTVLALGYFMACVSVPLRVDLVSQVWQCASDGSSSHKRSQFQLLAELEHDAGVSGAAMYFIFIAFIQSSLNGLRLASEWQEHSTYTNEFALLTIACVAPVER